MVNAAVLLIPVFGLPLFRQVLLAMVLLGGASAIVCKVPMNESLRSIFLIVIIVLAAVWAITLLT